MGCKFKLDIWTQKNMEESRKGHQSGNLIFFWNRFVLVRGVKDLGGIQGERK